MCCVGVGLGRGLEASVPVRRVAAADTLFCVFSSGGGGYSVRPLTPKKESALFSSEPVGASFRLSVQTTIVDVSPLANVSLERTRRCCSFPRCVSCFVLPIRGSAVLGLAALSYTYTYSLG